MNPPPPPQRPRVLLYGDRAMVPVLEGILGATASIDLVTTSIADARNRRLHRLLDKHDVEGVILAMTARHQAEAASFLAERGLPAVLMPPELPVGERPYPLNTTDLRDPFGAASSDGDSAFANRVGRLITEGELGAPNGLFCGIRAGGETGKLFHRLAPEDIVRHPLTCRFRLIERWYGPIREVHARASKAAIILTWKHELPQRYGQQQIAWSPDLPVNGPFALDETYELTGTCGILWIANVHGNMRSQPDLQLRHGATTTTLSRVWGETPWRQVLSRTGTSGTGAVTLIAPARALTERGRCYREGLVCRAAVASLKSGRPEALPTVAFGR